MARKLEKDAKWVHKVGRRRYGATYDGAPYGIAGDIYLAWRSENQVWRDGKPKSRAIAEGFAAWALDDATLLMAAGMGLEWIGVWVRDNDEIFLTPLADYRDPSKARPRPAFRATDDQILLPLQHFRLRLAA